MTEKVKVGYVIDQESTARLRAMSDYDRRTLSGMVEWLIDREWGRRQGSDSLIDSPEPYRTEAIRE